MKKLYLLGTRHYLPTNIPADIQSAVNTIIEKCHPQAVLEEWTYSKAHESARANICKPKLLPWRNIGTPDSEEFRTYGETHALDFPTGANIQRYGPILNQIRREDAMRANIVAAMSSFDSAVVGIGVAHLHSMHEKLSSEFDVDAYAFGLELS